MSTGGAGARRRPTICLSMIVRDEAHVIREALDTVVKLIDCWVIVDTGSTDSTIDTVRSHMAAEGLPGEIHQCPWRDFGSNRTEALQLCRGKADYIWVIDADDRVVGDLDLGGLRADSYLLRYGDDFRYWRRQIFRDGLRWRYEGAVHEFPACLDPATEVRLEGDYHIDSRRLGARSRSADKYQRDAVLLREAVERDPADTRSTFYLAQSHFDAGAYADALEWYTRRAEMNGWGEETFYSHMRRAACLAALGEPWERSVGAYLEGWQARPTRAEPLYEIAHHYRVSDSFELGYLFAKRAVDVAYPESDSLFIAADVYDWRAADELAICAYYTGRHQESFDLTTSLLEGSALPESERPRVEMNRGFCVSSIAEPLGDYPEDVVARINASAAHDPAANPEVTLTITSCCRPVLFERTINSFLRCCTDVERIGRWICIDSGSTEVDRARVRERYPFFEFIYGEPPSLSHSDSMNRLRDTVSGEFWLHLEDDWQFFWSGPYVERSIAIFRDDPAIAQVAFNRNYGETLECRRIVGGEVRRTVGDQVSYRLHEHVAPDTPDWEQHLAALPAGALSVAYWPHFTLRPSLMRAGAIRSLGRFAPGTGHFELEFAKRYAAAGLKTAFFDAINALHTGRLTTQGPNDGRLSAYDLVGNGEHPASPRRLAVPSAIDQGLEIRVINLDRRPDRLRLFHEAFRTAAGVGLAERCRRFAAIDGAELTLTPEIRRLFRGNDFAFRRGIVGCALSHIEIWRSLAERGADVLELVLEDDARPCDQFDGELASALSELRDAHTNFDVAFLGSSSTEAQVDTCVEDATWRQVRWQHYVGGLFAYVVSGRGARKLVDLVERDGVQNGIDTFLMLHDAELRVLERRPPLVVSPLAFAGNGVDSDIQHEFEPVSDDPKARDTPGGRRALLANLVPSLSIGELRLDTDPDWPCSGATIAAGDDGFCAIVRTASEMGSQAGVTLNYMVSLDEDLEVRAVEPLADDAEGSLGARWFDACRLVRLGETWIASALECSLSGVERPVLLRLDGAAVIAVEPLDAANGHPAEACAPFALGEELRLVTSWSPMRIRGHVPSDEPLGVDEGRPSPPVATGVSAGSAGAPMEDGWLFVVRDADAAAHRLFLLDRRCALVAASPQFTILGDDDERCWGLAVREGRLVISFGVDGRAAGLAVLPVEEALALMEPCR